MPSQDGSQCERRRGRKNGRSREKKELFIELAGACSPKRLVPPSPPCLHSSTPLFPTPPCLELREGEIVGRIQSSTSNVLHAPHPLTLPLLSRRWRKHPTASRGWQREPWEKKQETEGSQRRDETSKRPPHVLGFSESGL